jgi:hypothetical protein
VLASCAALLLNGCAIPIFGATPDPSDRHEQRSRRVELDRPAPRTLHASGEACYRALVRAKVSFERRATAGVEQPVLLRGPLAGVEVVPRDGKLSHAVLDCRLALALLAWAQALREAGVTRIEHYSIYRRGARVGAGGSRSGHARGLAIDAARFHLHDGQVLDVLTDWEDRERGSAPCPRRSHEAWPSRLLRGLVCEAVDESLFQVVITPHHDRAHENHVHLERRPDVSWQYVR